MKVSIVSLYGYFNYGNRLQSYAAQEILKQLGCEPKVIYIQPFKDRLREILKKVYFSKIVRSIVKPKAVLVNKYTRQRKFEKFNKEYILTKSYTSIKRIEDADYFILGSDQVWNPKRYNDTKKELFLLTFTDSKKKVCLAPSFGLNDLPDNWKNYFADKLSSFPMLSVRETSGAEIIKKLTGRESEILIDPTLMLDREDWSRISQKPDKFTLNDGYILNYFLGNLPEDAKVNGINIQRDSGCVVYNLLDSSNADLYVSSPSEFLYLIEHASLIQTDSFHACVFSFLFSKPFLVYAREGADSDMFSRIETFLSTFSLERKYVGSGIKNDTFECNYSIGYETLQAERKKEIIFLRKSMHLMQMN